MKINQIQPNTQIKQPIIKRIKHALTKPFANLKELVCDVFEYQKPRYVIVDGKKIKTDCSWLSPRELPNCVSGPSDWAGCTGGRIIFSREDQKIIDELPTEDAIKYIGKLINEKKYKFPE